MVNTVDRSVHKCDDLLAVEPQEKSGRSDMKLKYPKSWHIAFTDMGGGPWNEP